MKIVSVGTLKGGTGKTTMTFNLGGALAENSRVLLMDIDPQCNLSNNTGLNIAMQDIYSSRDIFENPQISPELLVIRNPIPGLPLLDIIPSHIRMIESELNIGTRAARERILEYYIDDHREFFENYDYILIDTNPSMGPINQNAFNASDSIILVSDVDNNSRMGIQLFLYLWGRICSAMRRENNVKALVLNRADFRTNLTGDIWEYFRTDDELASILTEPAIRERISFRRAALQKVPVTLYKEGRDSAEEIRQLIANLKVRGVF